MYIRNERGEHLLIRTVKGPDGLPVERILAKLGKDAELNLFPAAEEGRRRDPDLWDDVDDFHLLQALENYKRRIGNCRPVLVAVDGKRTEQEAEEP